MMNRVVLVGRVTKDLELKRTTSGMSVVSFSLAIDNRVKNGAEKLLVLFQLQHGIKPLKMSANMLERVV